MRHTARDLWTQQRPGHHTADVMCPAPWVSLEFDPAGWVLACCAGQMFPLGRIPAHRLRDVWNGDRAEVLREAMRRWDPTVTCGVCRWHLEHGRPDPVAAVYDAYPLPTDSGPAAAPTSPFMMQFALSNHCNLACVMCNGELSSRIRRREGRPPLPSPYGDDFFTDLEPMLAELKLVKFQGGEPLLVEEHHRVWSMLDQLDTPPRLLITTNGTVWNDTVDWLTDRFLVDISVSVDAMTAPTYSLVRGGDLPTVHRNLDRFASRARQRGTSVHVSFCLLRHNWSELADFLVWAEQFGTPASVNLVTDDGLALHDLPTAELDEVARVWASEAARVHIAAPVGGATFDVQREQLDSVLSERRHGVPSAPRQPQPAGPEVFATRIDPHVVVIAGDPATVVDAERHSLSRWSAGGVPGEAVLDDGIVTAIVHPLAAVGFDERLVGKPLGEWLAAARAADGRPLWLLDTDDNVRVVGNGDGNARVGVRVFGLSPTATRNTPGTMVRLVDITETGTTPGRTVLVGTDLIHETPAVPVHLTPRTTATP